MISLPNAAQNFIYISNKSLMESDMELIAFRVRVRRPRRAAPLLLRIVESKELQYAKT
jgi:hypothetical protein